MVMKELIFKQSLLLEGVVILKVILQEQFLLWEDVVILERTDF